MDSIQIRETVGPGDIAILHLAGPLTINSLFEFQDAARKDRGDGLILSLSEVPYMDSAGLGAVLGVLASCQRRGRKFALAGVGKRVMTILEVARVDSLVPRFETVEEAIRDFTASAA